MNIFDLVKTAKDNVETAELIHPGQQEQMNMRGKDLDLAVLGQGCLTSQCLTDKGRAALRESKLKGTRGHTGQEKRLAKRFEIINAMFDKNTKIIGIANEPETFN